MERPILNELEREVLVMCAIARHTGETTTNLKEEMLARDVDEKALEGTLRGLVSRGLMTTSRGVFGGVQHSRDGVTTNRVYEDDWWVVTEDGRRAVELDRDDAS